ncbi:transcription antitermination factor NusB [Ruminococcus sp.]|uniref:transcription antitermination factor NusB n=1 Tax=Ruminococcus sp. TaxID=41978 RepID=UPI002E79507B|nr:transcription antitermination factor NusB [Ruminococcus sp.]MEE1263646.1 transcription antitermination factor NusB [Ruminococcus sp.]
MCETENNEVKLTRSEAREQAFMLLFSKSFDDEPLEETIEDNSEMFRGGVCGYAQAVAAGMEVKGEEVDAEISKYLKKGWTLRRLSKPSLAILRLATYEILYLDSVPDGVAVNEAVELAKKYTIDESGFVNGILGSLVRAKEASK